MPNFTKGDITLAVLVDGEKKEEFPAKDSGYHFVGSECTNGANASWNSLIWSVNITNLKNTGTTCTLKFEKGELELNYGDGSLNEVENGYNDKIAFYDMTTNNDISFNSAASNYNEGNYNNNFYLKSVNDGIHRTLGTKLEGRSKIIKGNNEIIINRINSSTSLIFIEFRGGGSGFNSISSLQLYLNNNYVSLKQAVANKMIKPLVLITGNSYNANTSKINVLSLYDTGKVTINTFGDVHIYFMLENNVTFNRVKFIADNDFDENYDGIDVKEYKNTIMYLK